MGLERGFYFQTPLLEYGMMRDLIGVEFKSHLGRVGLLIALVSLAVMHDSQRNSIILTRPWR